MKSVVVVFHSGYCHTAKQANAVFEGIKLVEDIEAKLVSISDIEKHWDDLNNASAIIFGAPTYMGSLSSDFKKFMDSTSKLWFTEAWKDKIAAGFTNSGSLNGDKTFALLELFTFSAQHGMIWASLGLLPSSTSKAQRNDLNRLGSFTGAMAQSDVDTSSEVSPPEGDLATARHLGKRVAEIALRFK